MWGLIFNAIPGALNGILGYLQKRSDTELAKLGLSKDATLSIVEAERARQSSSLDVYKMMLNHPVFWIAWSLGVFPVMFYHAAIFWVSVFPFWGWTVLRVPADQIAFSNTVVGNVFLLTGASTVVAGLAHAWTKRV